MATLETITQYKQIRGKERSKLQKTLASKYKKGASVRALAEELGRSYGFVHRLLEEAGVELRSRGGAHGRRAKA